ncbi:MAG: transmembrane sensor [bacterium]|jgi:transmembrane sensor
MKRQEFDDISYPLLARLFAGECSSDELGAIQIWKSASDENAKEYASAKMLWIESQEGHFDVHGIREFDESKAWDSVSKSIKGNVKKMRSTQQIFRIAAILAVVLTVLFVAFKQFVTPHELVEVQSTDVKQVVQLKDGSEVDLNALSILSYNKEFSNDYREVTLNGEAFFKIERDTARPFIIKVNGIDIKVLGTSFNVNAIVPDSVEVQVETGLVELIFENQKIKLSAGETCVFYKDLGKFVKRESRVVVSQFWRNRKLTFKRTTLSEIINTLNDLYEVDIQVAESSQKERKINVRFEDQDIDLILDILSNTLNLKVEKGKAGEFILYDED